MLKKALRILVNYHPMISRRWKAATHPWFSLQAIDIAREMGVTPGLLCQTRHLGHSHQLHWSDVSKLELWYCLPGNWKLFAYTTIVLYESEEYIEIWRLQLFLARTSGWRCHCSTLTQRSTCSCKVVLMLWKQSKMLAPWQRRGCRSGVLKLCSIFLGAKWMVPLIQR